MAVKYRIATIFATLILGIAGMSSIAASAQSPVSPDTQSSVPPNTYITLNAGWNLVGWLLPTQDVGVALTNATYTVSVVWGFDDDTQTWHAYFPGTGQIPGANDLTHLTNRLGYFVHTASHVIWHADSAAG